MKSLIAALALAASLIAALPARAQFYSLNSEVPIPFASPPRTPASPCPTNFNP